MTTGYYDTAAADNDVIVEFFVASAVAIYDAADTIVFAAFAVTDLLLLLLMML